jgi:hypothetical protein
MSEFSTLYPRRINLLQGISNLIKREEVELDHLFLMVKIRKDEIVNTLMSEGFKMEKFEHKKPSQIGSVFSKKLKRPWEMHVRLLDFNQGLIGIHAEVEISRNYFQHIKSVRVPVVYEIESILKKHRIEYRLWHSFIKDYITNIVDDHQIELKSPKIPALPWIGMLGFISSIAILYGLKFFMILK